MTDSRYPNIPDFFVPFRTMTQYDAHYLPTDIDVDPKWGTLAEKQGTINYIVDYFQHHDLTDADMICVDGLSWKNEYDSLSLPEYPSSDDIINAGFEHLFSCRICSKQHDFYRIKGGHLLVLNMDEKKPFYFTFNPKNPPVISKTMPLFFNGSIQMISPPDHILYIRKYVDNFISKKKDSFTDDQYEAVETKFYKDEPEVLFTVIEGYADEDTDKTTFSVSTYYVTDECYYKQEYARDFSDLGMHFPEDKDDTITYSVSRKKELLPNSSREKAAASVISTSSRTLNDIDSDWFPLDTLKLDPTWKSGSIDEAKRIWDWIGDGAYWWDYRVFYNEFDIKDHSLEYSEFNADITSPCSKHLFDISKDNTEFSVYSIEKSGKEYICYKILWDPVELNYLIFPYFKIDPPIKHSDRLPLYSPCSGYYKTPVEEFIKVRKDFDAFIKKNSDSFTEEDYAKIRKDFVASKPDEYFHCIDDTFCLLNFGPDFSKDTYYINDNYYYKREWECISDESDDRLTITLECKIYRMPRKD